MVTAPVNCHDNSLFDESFCNLLEIADDLRLDLQGSYLTLDSGFDSESNKCQIEFEGLIPVIKPNARGLKNQEKINAMLDRFEEFSDIYVERYKIEKCFAWEDVYRKLAIRYERLQSTFMGYRLLAGSMINFRSIFK